MEQRLGQDGSFFRIANLTVPLTFNCNFLFLTSSCNTLEGTSLPDYRQTLWHITSFEWVYVQQMNFANVYRLFIPQWWFFLLRLLNNYMTCTCNGERSWLIYFWRRLIMKVEAVSNTVIGESFHHVYLEILLFSCQRLWTFCNTTPLCWYKSYNQEIPWSSS